MIRPFYCSRGAAAGIRTLVQDRIRVLNREPVRSGAEYVLYWSQMNRRVPCNQALAYAIGRANELDLPLLVYEGLTCTYPNANDRIHTFMLENVSGFAADVRATGAGYCFYLRRRRTDANDALYRLASRAALVITDDYPTFLPALHNARVPSKIDVAFVAVDASCVVPGNRLEKREWAAYTIRPKIHRLLGEYLRPFELPRLKRHWSSAVPDFHVEVRENAIPELVQSCEIDHVVKPSTAFRGGYAEARRRLDRFLAKKLAVYAEGRNQPAEHATSNLSPYIHFGHISTLEVALAAKAAASKQKIGCDEFLEELIVRRELSFNFCRHSQFDSLDSLPEWAKKTLAKHARDEREPKLTREQLESGRTYDDIWNATQKELLLRGKVHGYYRMYWGKKLIEWCPTYEGAFDLMIELHERYALDGRDPNTYTSVLWCFGLHDRPWAERPVFGQLRYMSYEGMKRKTNVKAYIQEIEDLERTGRDPLKL
jgi:deoxyribodipyrimidine photo-lyase